MNLLAQLAARLAEWRRTCVEIGRLVDDADGPLGIICREHRDDVMPSESAGLSRRLMRFGTDCARQAR